MRKVILIFIVIHMFFTSFSFAGSAEGDVYQYLDNRFNGRFVLESGPKEVFCYVLGVIDSAYKTNPFKMTKLYPNASKSDIIAKVREYYRKHPEKIHRAVVDVVFSGCR